MNNEIARLLSEAGVTEAFGWQDIVIRQNYGTISPSGSSSDLGSLGRYFNLTVLARGFPAFVAKVRPAGHNQLARSTAIRCCLAGERQHGLSVSPAGIASSDRMTVQVSRFLRGPTVGRGVLRLSRGRYLQLLRTVLEGNAELSQMAMRECDLLKNPSAMFSLAQLASNSLNDAGVLAALNADEQSVLAGSVLEAGDLPSRPQHGDFWWANMIVVDGRVWVIDFDSYGEILVPLFDDMTFMLGTLGLRAGSLAAGIERLGSPDPESRACRALLVERARAESLTGSQVEGVAVYYLAYMASELHRRGGAVYSAPHVAALRYAARRLAAGERLFPHPPT